MSESFFNQPPANTGADTVYTMGGLDGLPAQGPAFDLNTFLGTAAQLAQLFPGGQEQPKYTPGLTDLTFTRSFKPGGSDSGVFWSPIPSQSQGGGGGGAPASDYYIPNIPLPDDGTSSEQASILANLLSSFAKAAGSPQAEAERLARLNAAADKINISNVFTPTNTFNPTNVNYQTQSQQQQQSMNGQNQSQDQDSEDDSQDDSSLQDILDSINNGSDSTDGAFDDDFFTDDSTVDTDYQVDDDGTDISTDTSTTTGPTTIKGGNGNDTIDLGTWENQQTIDGGNGVDTVDGPDETGFVESGPTNPYAEQVNAAYQKVFGRAPDAEGLDYWSKELAAGKSSTDLLRDLVAGAKGSDVQAAQSIDTVSKLYQNLLDRAPDAEGLAYYRSQLEAGASPDEVARNIVSGAKAGSEASKISQEEYERYFPPQRQEPVTVDPAAPVTNDNVQDLFPNVSPGDLATVRDATDRLQAYANQYMAENAGGSFDTSLFDPETFRTNFITDVAAKDPDLFSKISGLDLATIDFGEGMLGGSALPLVTAVNAAFNSDSFADAAGNIDRAFATAGIADVAATALAAAGLPVVGQVAAAAILLDSVLSKALGYESPIQDGVDWMARQTEKAMEYIGDTFGDIFSSVEDFVGGIGDFFGDLFGGIGDWFAEGGLVDLPGDSMYNANTQGVLPDIEGYARGGIIPLPGGGKIAKGPGGGLDDLIPTSIDGRRAAALSDGEFVIPADVVSMMGDGSSNAGAKRLYDLVKGIRQHKTGTSRQAGPLPVGKILERTMR